MKTLAECILKIREHDRDIVAIQQELGSQRETDNQPLWNRMTSLINRRQRQSDRLAAEVLKNFAEISDDELRSIMEIPITSMGLRIFQMGDEPPVEPEGKLYTCACGRLCKHCLDKSEETNEQNTVD